MKQSITEMYRIHSEADLEAMEGKFFRIAQAEEDKWLPYYYAAYSYISIAFFIENADAIDNHLDKAQEMLEKAFKINSEESELYVLQGLLYSMRITNPARGMKYSGLSNEALGKAEKLNPGNPRIWFCKAQNVYHTPSMFGGGTKKALPLYEKAAELFDTFEVPSELWPVWGKEINASQIAKIKEQQN
jgi:tetratricopeptide (TPR) repeat protein